MTPSYDQTIKSFSRVAEQYAKSFYHASKERLDHLVEIFGPSQDDMVLDIATGTGNTAFALAPHVKKVIGIDITDIMLDTAKKLGEEYGYSNIEWVKANVEHLPFTDGYFTGATCRASAHHFIDIDKALDEVRRVLLPGGKFLLVDITAPEIAMEFMHQIETIRDPSHVRSYGAEQWKSMLAEHGLSIQYVENIQERWDFEKWMDNMGLENSTRKLLRNMIMSADQLVKELLQPEIQNGKLFHNYWHVILLAKKEI